MVRKRLEFHLLLDHYMLRRAIVWRSVIERFDTKPYCLVGLKPGEIEKPLKPVL